jgi:hypothetical protein
MPRQNRPCKMTLTRGLYDAVTARRAAQRAADGLPPKDPKDLPWLCEDEIAAGKQRTGPQQIAPAARLTRAAKAKIARRGEANAGFERHARKCALCRHPALDEIERAYLGWQSGYDICRFFQIDDPDTVYRHVRAAGLDLARRQNVRTVVEHFIEQSRHVKITSSTILRSIRALSCLDDNGRWTDPPRTHILVHGPDIRSLPESGNTSPTDTEECDTTPPSSREAEDEDGGMPPSFERSEPVDENSSTDSLVTRHSPALREVEWPLATESSAPPPREQREPCENSSADSLFHWPLITHHGPLSKT